MKAFLLRKQTYLLLVIIIASHSVLFMGCWKDCKKEAICIDGVYKGIAYYNAEKNETAPLPIVDDFNDSITGFYWKFSENKLQEFEEWIKVGTDAMGDVFLDSGQIITDGDIITCSTDYVTQSITCGPNSYTNAKGEIFTYELSGDTLKITNQEGDIITCVKVDPSVVDNALEACDHFSDDDDDDDPIANGDTDISGVWKITAMWEGCADDEMIYTPVELDHGIEANYYAQITAHSFVEYQQLSHIPSTLPYADGVYYCSEMTSETPIDIDTEIVAESSVDENSMTTVTFERYDGKLLIHEKYSHEDGCIDTYYAERASIIDIAGALKNCDLIKFLDN